MALQPINKLKEAFRALATPTDRNFWDLIDSIWHKSEKMPMTQVMGLNEALANTASKEDLKQATTNFKGYHTDEDALRNAYPQSENKKDFFAWVGSKPTIIWKVDIDGGAWINTGDEPTEQEIDLAEYAKIVDVADKADKKTIYNVSQINNKFDYANNQTARNVILAASRSLGQVVSYKLGTGKWVTEQYIGADVSGWAVVANWKYLGGLQAEDIHQLLDNTIDKPISPKGVKDGVMDIRGIIKDTETSESGDFINVLVGFVPRDGVIFNDNDNDVTLSGYGCSGNHTAVKPSTRYLSNSDYRESNSIALYDSNKNRVGNAGINAKGEFTTGATTAFIRFIYITPRFADGYYVCEDIVSTTTDTGKLAVNVDVSQIIGATRVNTSIANQGVIPLDIKINRNALDKKNNPTIGGFFHTDYIKINGSTKYTSNAPDVGIVMWFYDADKIPIRWYSGGETAAFTSPRNSKFMRVNIKYSVIGGVNVTPASASSDFFKLTNLVIDESHIVKNSGVVTEVEAIPYTVGDSQTAGAWYGHSIQSAIKGKKISKVKLKVQTAGSIGVGFSTSFSGNDLTWMKEVPVIAGDVEIIIDRELPAAQFLIINGRFLHKMGAPNPIGGSINGVGNSDMCLGVFIESGEPSGTSKTYQSFGDSITIGIMATVPYGLKIASDFGLDYNNYAVNGLRVTGGGLLGKINESPAGFTGLSSIMIGINDMSVNAALGDVPTVLAKPFDSLDVNASFAEAFRLSIETLLRKSPDSIIVVITPIKAWSGKEVDIDKYRQVERDICLHFAIPIVDIHHSCGIAPLLYYRLMPDNLHPNDAGHLRIAGVLTGEFGRFFRLK